MRCRACNSPLESIHYYGKLGVYEDLCKRCFVATASIAHHLHPDAANAMVGRNIGQRRADAKRKRVQAAR